MIFKINIFQIWFGFCKQIKNTRKTDAIGYKSLILVLSSSDSIFNFSLIPKYIASKINVGIFPIKNVEKRVKKTFQFVIVSSNTTFKTIINENKRAIVGKINPMNLFCFLDRNT